MDELLKQIAFISTIPDALDPFSVHLLETLRARDGLHGAVAVLNARKYHTGHVFQVVRRGWNGPLGVTWERI